MKNIILLALCAALYTAGCSLEHADIPTPTPANEVVATRREQELAAGIADAKARLRTQADACYMYAHMIPEAREKFLIRAATLEEAIRDLDNIK